MLVVAKHAKNDKRKGMVKDGRDGNLGMAGVERLRQSLRRCTWPGAPSLARITEC